jgi:heavy metal translocating P-type ATPase
MKKKKLFSLMRSFLVPLLILGGIVIYSVLYWGLELELVSTVFALGIIALGSAELVRDTFQALMRRQFALDYIALLAIGVGVATGSYLVALVIVLMLSGGTTLEKYGMARAKESLTALTERIPNEVILWEKGKAERMIQIEQARIGDEILVRKGEVIPLDGVVVSDSAETDESSLTGEAMLIEKEAGDLVRSGTVNMGQVMVMRVTAEDKDSTYRKIIDMVRLAEVEKAPLVRLADRYSTIFTLLTFVIAIGAYIMSDGDMDRVLAVLVVATPCPLILATPIALFGGVNAAARHRVLVKKLASLEVLSRIDTIVFDKTGTITLGRPLVHHIDIVDDTYRDKQIVGIAAALERNSLHPLAKAIVEYAKNSHATRMHAEQVEEILGQGIRGVVEGVRYTLRKTKKEHDGNTIELLRETRVIARIVFEDKLKSDAKHIIARLRERNLSLHIFTGDKKENVEKIVSQLGTDQSWIQISADCSPEDKKNGIERLKKSGHVVAMIGDGINDAPALALADVGMVFSNGEHTAASEAADIVFLGGDLESVWKTIQTSKRTIRIALESIIFGIGLSVVAMVFAAFGFIPPIAGAALQEVIDIIVIVNALRASKA